MIRLDVVQYHEALRFIAANNPYVNDYEDARQILNKLIGVLLSEPDKDSIGTSGFYLRRYDEEIDIHVDPSVGGACVTVPVEDVLLD